MDKIKNILQRQEELSKEINELLICIDNSKKQEIEIRKNMHEELLKNKKEIELLKKENNLLIDKNARLEANNKLLNLKTKVNSLLSSDSIKDDIDFKNYLNNLSIKINDLSTQIEGLNNTFAEKNTQHEKLIKTKKDALSLQSKSADNKETIKTNIKSNNFIQKSNKITDNIELKIGSNVLNILGVIMILVSLVTFGKYIYTNYMTDTLKGIFLFAISSSILTLGECFFKKRVPKFAIGISALGIGSLYASLIMNFMILKTINHLVAIIFTLLISAISLRISSKSNSNIIRIIGLLGGYICFASNSSLDTVQSYITVAMLLIISISNIYIPINNRNFTIYSSILNTIFCSIIVSNNSLDVDLSNIYLICTIALNSFMYVTLCKDDCREEHKLSAFLTIFYLILIGTSLEINNLSFSPFVLIISLVSYYMSSVKLKTNSNINLKNIFYCQAIYLLFDIINTFTIPSFALVIIVCLVCSLTLYLIEKDKFKDLYLNLLGIIFISYTFINLMIIKDLLEFLVYTSLFIGIIWVFSKNYKDNIQLICYKVIILLGIIFNIIFTNKCGDIEINIFVSSLIAIIYVLSITNIDRLKDCQYKLINFWILINTLLVLNLTCIYNLQDSIITIILSITAISLMTNKKYVQNKDLIKYDIMCYSLFLTYAICLLFFQMGIDENINNVIFSIILMLFAFINVWIGFKNDKIEVRKYGLILSLIICLKLMIIDFYSYNFIVKTSLFLIVGILALIISYIYSKLEQELSNEIKSNNNDIKNNSIVKDNNKKDDNNKELE